MTHRQIDRRSRYDESVTRPIYVAVRSKAGFVEPMLLLRTEMLAEGDGWLYELKLDGFRAIAFKSNRKVFIRSRNDKAFNSKFPSIVR